MRPLVPPHMQNVPKAARGDHPDLGPVAFDHDVGRNRGAVKQGVDLRRLHTRNRAKLDHPLDDANRLVCGGRRYLVRKYPLQAARFDLFKHKVRERPADIDTDPYHSTPR